MGAVAVNREVSTVRRRRRNRDDPRPERRWKIDAMRAISGLLKPRRADQLEGQDVTGLTPGQTPKLRIVWCEGRRIFSDF